MLTDHDQTNPEEFKLFYGLLMQDAPKGYVPHLFKCKPGEKVPYVRSSWKDESERLSFEEAMEWNKTGGNVAIAARKVDCLVIEDVDDETVIDYTKEKQTLTCRTGSRHGVHSYYFEPVPGLIPFITVDKEKKPGEEGDNHIGEIRVDEHYVIAPGSWVKQDEAEAEKLDTKQKKLLGKYTVEVALPAASISPQELPKVFREKIEKSIEAEELQRKRNEEQEEKRKGTPAEQSALFSLTIRDVISNAPSDGQTFHSPFHDSKTGHNTSISENLLHCWRHNVSLNAIQALCVLSGYMTCEEAGTPHRGGAGGFSAVVGDDRAIWEAWKYAKERGLIPADDPIPSRALNYVVVSNQICKPEDIKDGWKIPSKAYNASLELIKNEGIDPGRELNTRKKEKRGEEKSEKYSLDEILNMHRVEEEEEIKLYARNVREEGDTRKKLFLCIQDVKGNSIHVEGKTVAQEEIFFPHETQPGELLLNLAKDKEKCYNLALRALFDELKKTYAKFVHFSEDIEYDIVALSAISSYFRNAIDTYPLIYFTSPSINTGKTTALYCLIYSSWYGMISSNLSEAVIYRAVNDIHPTLGLDEVDKYLKRPDIYINIISLFNTSNKRGSYVYRIEKSGDKEIVKGYEHWGLKGLSGLYSLPPDMDSRAITIRMKRYTGEGISKTVPIANNFEEIRDKLYVYALINQDKVREVYEELKTSCPLEGRKFEKWAGILAIAKMVGEYDTVLKYAQGIQENYGDLSDRDQALLYTLFINKLVGERSTKEITEAYTEELRAREILGRDKEGEERKVSFKEVPTSLKNFGFEKTKKKTDNKTWFNIKTEDLIAIVKTYDVVEKELFEIMLKEAPYSAPPTTLTNVNYSNYSNSLDVKTTREELEQLGKLGKTEGMEEEKQSKKGELLTIQVLEDLQPFVDYSGKNWKEGIKKGSIINIENRTGKLLIEKEKAKILDNVEALLDRQAKEANERMREMAKKDSNEDVDGICEWCGKQTMVRVIKGSYTCRGCEKDVLKEGSDEQL